MRLMCTCARAETFDEVVRGGSEEEVAATLEIQTGYLVRFATAGKCFGLCEPM